jgi:hypothetical protein
MSVRWSRRTGGATRFEVKATEGGGGRVAVVVVTTDER